jgi:hypothetical protein
MSGLMDEYFQACLAGLMAASCQSLHVISSFTLSQLDTYLSVWEAPGMRMYAAYLRYAGSQGAEAIAKPEQAVDDYYRGMVGWPLLQEISRRSATDLQGFGIKVADYWPGNGLPMLVTGADGSKAAVNTDGFWAEGSSTDYYWEWHQGQYCVAAGFQLLEISSQAWWKNPLNQLSRFIADVAELSAKTTESQQDS